MSATSNNLKNRPTVIYPGDIRGHRNEQGNKTDGSSVDTFDWNDHGHANDVDVGEDAEVTMLQETIYDLISKIRDPEKPDTLEDLNVITESGVKVHRLKSGQFLAHIEFVPTVPHCSLASIIGLTMRSKLEQHLPEKLKVDIYIKKGTHNTADEINKQINDKERISAAMENPNLQKLVRECIDPEGT